MIKFLKNKKPSNISQKYINLDKNLRNWKRLIKNNYLNK